MPLSHDTDIQGSRKLSRDYDPDWTYGVGDPVSLTLRLADLCLQPGSASQESGSASVRDGVRIIPADLESGNQRCRSVQELELALENMPVGVSWASLEDQVLVHTSLRFTEMFGYTAADFRDIHDWIDRAYPLGVDRKTARQRWSRYLNQPSSLKATVTRLRRQ